MSSCAGEPYKTDDGTSLISTSLSKAGLIINRVQVTETTTLQELEAILGKPNRSKLPDQGEVTEKRANWGMNPSNIYTFDSLGVVVYQDIGAMPVTSIVFDLQRRDKSFSPLAVYPGVISIAGVSLNTSTSVQEIRQIQRLVIKETLEPLVYRMATYLDYDLTLIFDGRLETSTLTSIAIALPKPPEIADKNGWSEKDKAALKASFFNTSLSVSKRSKEIVVQAGGEYEPFVNCYCDEIIRGFKKSDVENPSQDIQQRMASVMQDCLSKNAIKH